MNKLEELQKEVNYIIERFNKNNPAPFRNCSVSERSIYI